MSAFDAAALAAALPGRPLRFFASCGSTNRVAWDLGLAGAPGGALVVADAQSAGRGRLDRGWASPPGLNLYLSLLLRPRLPPQRAPLACLAAAAGACDVLGEAGVRIKWPNDLVAPDDRKLAGVLAEVRGGSRAGQRGAVEFLVLGIGINVNQRDFPPELPGATSLALLDGERDRAALLGALVAAIEARVAQLEADPAGVLDACRARSATLGRPVRVGAVEGLARSIREDGALMVEAAGGVVPVLAGDIEMIRQG